jgi:type IV secretory pathway VirB6-like protein
MQCINCLGTVLVLQCGCFRMTSFLRSLLSYRSEFHTCNMCKEMCALSLGVMSLFTAAGCYCELYSA